MSKCFVCKVNDAVPSRHGRCATCNPDHALYNPTRLLVSEVDALQRKHQVKHPNLRFPSRVMMSTAAKLLRSVGEYAEAEALDGQKDLHPIFDLAQQVQNLQAQNDQKDTVIARLRGGESVKTFDEHNMVSRFCIYLEEHLGVKSKKEHRGIDILFLGKQGRWFIGEAKFIKKAEMTSIHDCLKVLKYQWDFKQGRSVPFALFNQRISDDSANFLKQLGITTVFETTEGVFDIQESASHELTELFVSRQLAEAA